jgi:hypothetical protein
MQLGILRSRITVRKEGLSDMFTILAVLQEIRERNYETACNRIGVYFGILYSQGFISSYFKGAQNFHFILDAQFIAPALITRGTSACSGIGITECTRSVNSVTENGTDRFVNVSSVTRSP